jgi:hypothetical protein
MITKLKQNIKILNINIMKTNQKPAISKLVERFDNELRAIIMNDLKMIKGAKNNFLRAIKNDQLSVA